MKKKRGNEIHCLQILLLWPFILFLACPAAAQSTNKIVIAEGVAAIRGENIHGARAAAVENALHNAIEQGLGAIMDAKSIVKNDRLLEQIYTHTRGYIPEYEIVREEKTDDGLYRVTISAVIKTGELKNRMEQLGILKQMMDFPRMVIMPKAGGMDSEAIRLAGKTMSGFFADNRFDVVTDRSMAPGRPFARAGEPMNPARAGHAEILVIYELTAEPSQFDGIMQSAPVSLSAQALDTSNGQVFSSKQVRTFGLGQSSRAALTDGAQKASAQLADLLSGDILGWWAEYTVNGLPYHLVLKTSPDNGRQIIDFQKQLQSIPGVTSLTERGSGREITEIQLTYKGRATELKHQIIETFSNIKIIASEGRYMELSFPK